MKTKGLMFTDPMVRLIIARMKTETRRVCRYQCDGSSHFDFHESAGLAIEDGPGITRRTARRMRPWYVPGDRMYVRECVANMNYPENGDAWTYRATTPGTDQPGWSLPPGVKWTPAMLMPKAAARVWSIVQRTRMEHLLDITEDGARREGFPDRFSFLQYFEGLGRRNELPENPLVWVYRFEVERVD